MRKDEQALSDADMSIRITRPYLLVKIFFGNFCSLDSGILCFLTALTYTPPIYFPENRYLCSRILPSVSDRSRDCPIQCICFA